MTSLPPDISSARRPAALSPAAHGQRDRVPREAWRSALGAKRRTGKTARWGFSLCCFVMSLMLPGHSYGQAAPKDYPVCNHEPTETDVSAAKGAYRAGQVSFQEADYERALLYWEDAFRRDCTAVKLLLNIARAYELSGDRRAAVHALVTYLERDPDWEDRSAVEKRIEKLNQKLAEEQAAEDARRKAEEAERAAREREREQAALAAAPRRAAWPVAVTTSGAALAIGGGALLALGVTSVNQDKNDIATDLGCERAHRNTACPSDEQRLQVEEEFQSNSSMKRGRTVRTSGIVLAGAGAVTTTVGAIFWAKLWKSTPPPRAARLLEFQAVPVVFPGYQGLSLGGSF